MTDVVSDGQPLPAALENGPDEPKKPLVLDFAAKGADESPGLDAGVKVADIHLTGVFGAFEVVPHGVRDVISDSGPAPTGDGCATVRVHPAHQDRLHRLHEKPVDDAVRPEWHDLQLPLLLAAVVINCLELWPGRHIASL